MRGWIGVVLCVVCVACLAAPVVAEAQYFDGHRAEAISQTEQCDPAFCPCGQCLPGVCVGNCCQTYAAANGGCMKGGCQPLARYQQFPMYAAAPRGWHTSSVPAWGSFRRW